MTLPVLPVVGSSGYYEFLSPFDKYAIQNIEYTCQAVRRISDYLANNEDVEKDVYETYEISDTYQQDLSDDTYIVSLQSKTGHWLYVPYRYIQKYPSVNGVPYRTMMIGIALPAIPVSHDFTAVLSDLKDLASTALGVPTEAKLVETSRIVLVPYEKHAVKEAERQTRRAKYLTLSSRLRTLQSENQELREQLKILAKHIQNMP